MRIRAAIQLKCRNCGAYFNTSFGRLHLFFHRRHRKYCLACLDRKEFRL